jgi:hypothetical protein
MEDDEWLEFKSEMDSLLFLSRKMKIKRQGWKQPSKFGVWFGQAFSVWFDYLSKFSLIVTK